MFDGYEIFIYIGLAVVLSAIILSLYTIRVIKELERKTPICLDKESHVDEKSSNK